ncbi:MAG TPA: ester cyclase, partial [Aggregatilineales bacterium]|nr:ester cyclase [Aggregatilineales bacterium]
MKAQRILMVVLVLILGLGSLSAPVNAQADVMEANKATFTRIIDEAWNAGNLDAVNEIVAPDFVAHTPNGDIETADGLRNLVIGNLRGAMSDLHMEIDLLIAEADWVGSRVTMTGTFDGVFLTSQGPIQSNGQPVVLTFNNIDRFENGQFVEEWTAFDTLAFLTQLGAIPMPEGAPGD